MDREEAQRLLLAEESDLSPDDAGRRNKFLQDLADEAEAGYDIDKLRPRRKASAPDWMHITIEINTMDGAALLVMLKEKLGFHEIDWCEMQRPDRGRVSYGPCPPRTDSGYTIDPFPRQES